MHEYMRKSYDEIISNDEMEGIMKIVKSLEYSALLLKTIQYEKESTKRKIF